MTKKVKVTIQFRNGYKRRFTVFNVIDNASRDEILDCVMTAHNIQEEHITRTWVGKGKEYNPND